MTHFIKHLSFGKDYPGIINPLDGTNVAAPQGKCMSFLFHALSKNQYSKEWLENIDLFRIKEPFIFSMVISLSTLHRQQKSPT